MDLTFNPGSSIAVGACFKPCGNRGKRCAKCYRRNGKETEFIKNNKKNRKEEVIVCGQNIAYLLSRDNWDAVELMDNWLFVYDRLPKKMRLVVDLKINGMSNKAIARRMRISMSNVGNQILRAKKRILRGENIL